MTFCDIDTVEKVAIEFVIKLGGIEGFAQVFSAGP
jgi:hypothetical protein